MGRPKGSKNKPRTAAASASPRASGARKAVPTNFADTSLGAGTASGSKTRSRSKAKPRSRTAATPKPDWSTLRFGVLLGETKAIKKAFASQDEALGYVKSLPVTKQAKAKLVTVQALKVETSISILPVNTTETVLTDMQPEQTIRAAVAARKAISNAPAITAALNKVTDAALQAGAARAKAAAKAAKTTPVKAPPEKPAHTPQSGGNGSKNSRLDLIAARAAKLGHTPHGSAKADVLAVAATELAADDAETETDSPEDDAPDLSASDD